MIWSFRKKPRRPRGPDTPQARSLLWDVFRREEQQRAATLGLPESAWASQDSFERFLTKGFLETSESWMGDQRQTLAFRLLVWRYRESTKRRFGAAFLEKDEEPRLSKTQILSEMRRSDRWGVNEQPGDPDSFAQELARLPVFSVTMKGNDTMIIRFLRPLLDDEAEVLLRVAHAEESPFTPGDPRLEAFLWWD